MIDPEFLMKGIAGLIVLILVYKTGNLFGWVEGMEACSKIWGTEYDETIRVMRKQIEESKERLAKLKEQSKNGN